MEKAVRIAIEFGGFMGANPTLKTIGVD